MADNNAPLAGIRVVELTTAWAGPMAGRILAYLGAEVIRIEAASRPCGWRHHAETRNVFRYPNGDPGARPYNRTALFNSQNVGKLAIALDLKRPGGYQTLLKLLAETDVVISNFTPGTLARLKLDYARLCGIRPDIIVVEMPAYGTTGPMSAHTALGPTMEMAAGMASMIGYRDGGAPTYTGPSYMDSTGGYNGAAAVMTALAHRRATGRGQHVEMPQVEAAMQYIGADLLYAIATGRDPERQGNRVSWAAPHDTFPALGTDEWVAIAVTDDRQWAALCGVIGDPRLSVPEFSALDGRLHAQDTLHAMISDWTRERTKHAIADQLQAAGVPAAPVQKADDALASPYLAARGFYTTLDHPEAGRHPYQGLPFHFDRTPASASRPAPCLGEHTHAILSELLHLSPEEIRALEASGTIADTPPAANAA
jgi:crotonobetainyl-CoA:carnitine CoA-transferase CaiB-like acyl-CoA transferase